MALSKENTRIVADSSSDVLNLSEIPFASAPLKIITSVKEYVDDASLNVEQMVDELRSYSGQSSTSCPNVEDWLSAFGEAEHVFCVTISGSLSGSYNTALLAAKIYETDHPDRRVFVVNSLSTGPEMKLIIERLRMLVLAEKSFDDICKAVTHYHQKHTGLLFVLESMRNLANNGRVSPLTAKLAGLLGIRVVGKASDEGTLEVLNKCRGMSNALETVVKHMKSLGYNGGKVKISHCFNEEAVQKLKDMIKAEFEKAKVEIYGVRGLCAFYAEKGGLLIGFEKAMKKLQKAPDPA